MGTMLPAGMVLKGEPATSFKAGGADREYRDVARSLIGHEQKFSCWINRHSHRHGPGFYGAADCCHGTIGVYGVAGNAVGGIVVDEHGLATKATRAMAKGEVPVLCTVPSVLSDSVTERHGIGGERAVALGCDVKHPGTGSGDGAVVSAAAGEQSAQRNGKQTGKEAKPHPYCFSRSGVVGPSLSGCMTLKSSLKGVSGMRGKEQTPDWQLEPRQSEKSCLEAAGLTAFNGGDDVGDTGVLRRRWRREPEANESQP